MQLTILIIDDGNWIDIELHLHWTADWTAEMNSVCINDQYFPVFYCKAALKASVLNKARAWLDNQVHKSVRMVEMDGLY